ncbi:MAG: uroporphyrinogen decarboxylase family protein [Armatimonadota bacterium]|nr:uroporphyrinogen decarboxylase family protein [Armatimonadota bacterium]MDR7401163.1 uroporphyrinogen decarboxylase family protein [Armatimonadota bacterium]MDR7403417.1 uroporphyrinogen decarboxylase family protein [Armatimonadota bacterium]MDR7438041.1 uroporphyrinogen decarboxylase family protein [Armatimonadota bacterium]MDR7471818.1 uroporphyrinogen decarboxylase family protein [Armatimonadota bacterium]
MTGRERVLAAIRGAPVDRVPVALWRHFPTDDQKAETLARAHIAFQRQFGWDLLKVTPASGYYGDDWGLRAGYRPNREGVRHYTDRPVKRAADWRRLRVLDVTAGAYGRELHALGLIRGDLADDLILATVFSPLTVARTLCGDQALVRYLRESPDDLVAGLEVISEVTARFASEALAAGADGIFFATQCATTDYLTVEEYEEFGRPYDLRVLEAAAGAEVRMLHLHGTAVMFDQLADYPVDIINWHDRRTPPTLAEARRRYSGCLAGGVDEWGTLSTGTTEEIAAQVADAIAQAGGRGLLVTAGCVVPVDLPPERLLAVRRAVERPP